MVPTAPFVTANIDHRWPPVDIRAEVKVPSFKRRETRAGIQDRESYSCGRVHVVKRAGNLDGWPAAVAASSLSLAWTLNQVVETQVERLVAREPILGGGEDPSIRPLRSGRHAQIQIRLYCQDSRDELGLARHIRVWADQQCMIEGGYDLRLQDPVEYLREGVVERTGSDPTSEEWSTDEIDPDPLTQVQKME